MNAITDIAGIEVGHTTLIEGDSVRTGVTVVWPRGKQSDDPTFGGWFAQNGNGEMTGTTWLEESGFLEGAVFITNTHSVGVVRDASIAWQVEHKRKPATNSSANDFWSLPVVAETWDGRLNDINGFHVKPEHVFQAMDSRSVWTTLRKAMSAAAREWFALDLRAASGLRREWRARIKVAALVQCNCGVKKQLRIAGAPVGQELAGRRRLRRLIRRRCWIDHYCCGDRCSAAAHAVEAAGAACDAWAWREWARLRAMGRAIFLSLFRRRMRMRRKARLNTC